MSIYEAIFNRCSVREYEMEKLAPGRLEALERYLKNIALLDEEKTVKFEIIDNSDGKQKIHGLWKVEAPYYLAVYCGNDQLSVRNAGYAAEQAVLYLTSKELGTCYLGATKAGEEKKDGLKRFLVIAFGRLRDARPAILPWLTALPLRRSARSRTNRGAGEGDPACRETRSVLIQFPAMALCRLFGPDLYLCEKNTPVFRKRKARL